MAKRDELDPDFNLQEFGAELRRLRQRRGLTGERLAARAGIGQSKVSRLETGRVMPTLEGLERLILALKITAPEAETLRSLASSPAAEYYPARVRLKAGWHHKQPELQALVRASACVRFFCPAMPTGLFQEASYARSVLTNPLVPRGADLSKVLEARLRRQEILLEGGRTVQLLLTEAAVGNRIANPVTMVLQTDRLISLSRLPGVQIGEIPQAAALPLGPLHTFVVYDERLATAELFSGELIMRDPRDIEVYLDVWSALWDRALSADETRHLLAAIRDVDATNGAGSSPDSAAGPRR